MTVFPASATVSMVACLFMAAWSQQMVQEANFEETASTLAISSTTEGTVTISTATLEGNTTELKSCVTARNIAGNCLERQYCEYSTYAIDLTLYEPHGYKRTCIPGEVCCPPAYQTQPKSPSGDAGADFNFDDDD